MYLQLRGSTYYFRFNIPPQYRHVLGWSITRSLCSCPVISDTVAKTLGRNLRKIMSHSLDDTTIKQLIDKYISRTLKTIDRYINTREAVSMEAAQAGIEVIQLQQTEHEEALFKRSYKGVDRIVDDLLKGQEVDTPSRNKLSRAVLRAAVDLHDVQISAMEGEPVPTTLDDKEVHSVDTPAIIAPVNPLPIPGPLLSEFIETYDKSSTGWSIATRKDYNSSMKVTLKILGDIPVGTITRTIMVNYRETLLKVPTYWANRHKNVSVSDLPIPDVDTLSKATIEKYLTYINGLMNYAVDCEHLSDSPMPRSRMSIPDDKINVRPFSDKEVGVILGATQHFDDHRYWLPLIALYTGCRENELCQLHKEDLKQLSDIWYLDINATGKKTLKNPFSKRLVPLHPVIIELGFLEYIETVKHHRIFPGCIYRPDTGKYGNNFGSWFGRTLVKNNIKKKGDRSITFHSLRHRFITVLKRLKVEHTLVDQLTGHIAQGTSNREYFDGYLLPDLKEGVDHLPDHRNL